MRKDDKKAPKANRPKKSTVKDLSPRDAKAVKGGKVAVQDLNFVVKIDKSSPTL